MKQKLIIHAALLVLSGIVPGQGLLYSQDLDGAATAALQGELPDTGFFAASNGFARNATVNVTNLDNGKTTQVVIAKGLDAAGYGFLLTLSRDAANAIGIYGRDVGRVRVTLPTSSPAFSRYNDGRSFSGDPDYDPRAFVRSNSTPFSGTTLSQAPVQSQGTAYSETVQPFHTYTPVPDNTGGTASSVPITTMPLSDALSLQPGQSALPNVVPVPPTPVDPVVIVMPSGPQGISTQNPAAPSALAYGGYTAPLSEPAVSAPATKAVAVVPYHDPGETEVILRSPGLVLEAPLPEMGTLEPSTAEGTGIVYTGDSEDNPPLENAGTDYPTVYTHSDTPLGTSPNIVPDEPNYPIKDNDEDAPPDDFGKAEDDYPTIFTPSGDPPVITRDIVTNEPEYTVTEVVEDSPAAVSEIPAGDTNNGEIALGDPWYVIREDNADAGQESPDDGGEVFDTALAEPGYRFTEDEERADTADMTTESGLDDGEIALGEPWYVIREDNADAGQELPDDGGEVFDMALAEPEYLITEGESAPGVGGGEELPHDTTPPVTVTTTETPEYLSGPLIPFERTDFPVSEPRVNIAEDIKETEREEPPALKAPDSLEKGKYYVQIGGYSSAERIEAIMRELQAAYPLVVMGQRYILIGPLNEGESNALQQQFRVRGYPNAFVVRGK
jgi:hypothetical protein